MVNDNEIPAFAGTDICLPLARSRSKLSGWIILDKPSGITSAHAVAKVKRLLKPEKIGHAGTLDPMASGILPLALGEATKTIPYMMDAAKTYQFTVTWGEERDTDDAMGEVTASSDARPELVDIEHILPQFTGTILQTPPDYSAIKVNGKRAYDLARSGEALELKAREVTVYRFQVSGSRFNRDAETLTLAPQTSTSFEVDCSKGTYIRGLARDMGRILGCFGHVSVLRRTKVGNFGETHAISLEVLAEMVHKDDLNFLRPVDAALDDIPACNVSYDQAVRLKRGQTIVLPAMTEEVQGGVILLRYDGNPVAMGEVSQGSVKPVRVFNV